MIKKIILVCIIILAIFLRVWNLNHVPPSASLDEASIGYNAYSVLHTGGDEFGQFPLISQRGYDDWRRSTYLLLVIPSVAIFGLNAVAVRLPAVILSILTVLASYFIMQFLFSKQTKFSTIVSLLVPLLLAISPWHIYISRLGHESNACLSFLTFGTAFFLWGEKRKKFGILLLSFFFFTLSMISYYSGQIFIPVFVGALFLIFRKSLFPILFGNKLHIVISIISMMIVAGVVINIFSPNSLVRFQGTSTFKPDAHIDLYNSMVKLRNEASKNHDVIGMIFNNRRMYPVRVFISGYLFHFDPIWLFTNPSGGMFKAPNIGLFYLWELPVILLGLVVLLVNKEISKASKIIIFLWFFLGALPPAVATQTPHAMRFYNAIIAWHLLIAIGVGYILVTFGKIRIILLGGLVFLLGYSIWMLSINYFVLFSQQQSSSFQYPMEGAIAYVNQHKNLYKKIVISNQDNLFQSYMFYLFFTKYDPKIYQQEGGTKSGGYAAIHKFDKFEFRPINWEKDHMLKDTLFVGNPYDFPQDAIVGYKGYYLNKKIGIEILQ